MTTLLILAILSSCALLFAQDISRIIQKALSIPGMKLLGPLVVISFLIEIYEDYLFEALLYIQSLMHQTLEFIASYLPFHTDSFYLIKIIFLCFMACVPLSLFELKNRRYHHQLSLSECYVSAVLWLICAISLLT